MKKFYYIFLILVSVMAVSCSEDGVTPHLKDTTLAFLPAADDNSEESGGYEYIIQREVQAHSDDGYGE